ncbi:MAG: YfhO family protein [Lachnospiraceae bacterium]|nr:YfhO family protein [Lachnospiraceae bacterium]
MKQQTYNSSKMIRSRFTDSQAAKYICAFLIPFLMTQAFWAICHMYPFGQNSILTGDMDVEFVNFYAYFINTLKTNNDWSYMLTKTLGGDFPGLAAFQLHDPLLFLLLLFSGDKIVAGIELIFSLQISIAGLSASVLLNGRYRRSWMSLLFSTGYAFSAFFFGYLVLTIYFGALSILPLVIFFFLEYLDEKKSPIWFIISACLFIYLNYHMGFMLVIFLVVLYVSRIIKDISYIKKLGSLVILAATVLLVDAFFLVRIGLSLIGEKTTEGADYGFYRRFPLDQLFAGMFSGCARNDLRPLIYCSVAVFFFAVSYFISKKFSIREKLADLFVIAVVAVSMWINSFDAVWHGFNNPEGFYWRYAYYISIAVIVTGYKGFISLTEDEEPGAWKKNVLISGGILYLYMAWLVVRGNAYLDGRRLVINAVITAAVTGLTLLAVKTGWKRTAAFSAMLLLSVCEMLYSSKTAYVCLNSEEGQFPQISEFKEDYRDIDSVISYVKSTDDGFYRIEKDFDRAINDPSMFGYIGISHDSSCDKDAILDWLVNFGFCKTVYFTYYNGGSTSFVDDLFGVKYYISRFDTVEKPYENLPYEGKYHAYRNDDALPLAFIAPDGLAEHDITKENTFEKQNALASYWNSRPIYIKAEPETELIGASSDGSGHYVRTEDEGYIVYNIKAESGMPLYFYFYAPKRQDGEVYVNGQTADVYFTVNHWNTLCAGSFNPGENIEIKMQIKGDELDITEACFYYEDPAAIAEWGESARSLNEAIGEVNEIKSSHLTFSTSSDRERKVIVSIPYEKAWKIKCDGERIEGGQAIGALMSFNVPAGEHVIDMKYVPEGTLAGICLSGLGIILFIVRIIYMRRKKY